MSQCTFDEVKREPGDNGTGDQRRFICKRTVTSEWTMVPQELKERKAVLEKELAEIDAALAEIEKADLAS
jgi:hypothetical protein